ncbi:MAG TPA: hypothetical protein VK402_01255 [Blastococcus sp.]|nr:hypothetical protein [Blastococcus sp.]
MDLTQLTAIDVHTHVDEVRPLVLEENVACPFGLDEAGNEGA